MNKSLILSIFLGGLIIAGSVVFSIYWKNEDNTDIDTSDTNTASTTETETENKTSPYKIDFAKVDTVTYNLIAYTEGIDPLGVQLKFVSDGQIDRFSPEDIYDAVLENSIDESGIINVSIAKLNNKDRRNENITNDGAYVLGQFILKNEAAQGKMILDTTSSYLAFEDDAENKFQSYNGTLPPNLDLGTDTNDPSSVVDPALDYVPDVQGVQDYIPPLN